MAGGIANSLEWGNDRPPFINDSTSPLGKSVPLEVLEEHAPMLSLFSNSISWPSSDSVSMQSSDMGDEGSMSHWWLVDTPRSWKYNFLPIWSSIDPTKRKQKLHTRQSICKGIKTEHNNKVERKITKLSHDGSFSDRKTLFDVCWDPTSIWSFRTRSPSLKTVSAKTPADKHQKWWKLC